MALRSKKPRLDNTVIDLDDDCDDRLNVTENIPIINLDEHIVNDSESLDLNNTIDLVDNSKNADNTHCDSKCKKDIENKFTDSAVAISDNQDNHVVPIINLDEHTKNYLESLKPNNTIDLIDNSENADNTYCDSKCEEDIENTFTDSAAAINVNQDNYVTEKHYIELDINKNHGFDHGGEPEADSLYKSLRIQEIELEIAKYKSLIDKLEEMEVTDDSANSPYIESEKCQKILLNLYKDLCVITGDEPVKRRTVKLRASDKRPELPMQKLEAIINNSIKSNGMPNFPDFTDVVNCVVEANRDGSLGWNRKTIMQEARVLFIHCGQALQRSRQKREWRFLLSRLKRELHDPADYDPELRARLEANKRVAKQNENYIIERFSKLEKECKMGKLSHSDIQETEFNKNFEVENTLYSNKETIDTNSKDNIATEQNHLTADHLVISQVFSCNNFFTEESGNQSEPDNSFKAISKDYRNKAVENCVELNKTTVKNKSNIEENNNLHEHTEISQAVCSITNNTAEVSSSMVQFNDSNSRENIRQESTVGKTVPVNTIYETITNIQVTKIEIENEDEDGKDIRDDESSVVNCESPGHNNNKGKEGISTEKKLIKDTLQPNSKDHSAITSNILNAIDVRKIRKEECTAAKINENKSLDSKIDNIPRESCMGTNIIEVNIQKETESNSMNEILTKKNQNDRIQNNSTLLYQCDESSNTLLSSSELSVNQTNQNISSNFMTYERDDNTNILVENSQPGKTDTLLENIKPEPDMSEFVNPGKNFSVTIVNIIDPYLVVEISSDSSSEDEDCEGLN